ncbi:MAG: ComEC/Rec2 family competence protein [Candidatus Berkelbacteria bacterium]|nr:ComEC/Rec2 family competence protein [Candidatus Berkelbacteria bacterium]
MTWKWKEKLKTTKAWARKFWQGIGENLYFPFRQFTLFSLFFLFGIWLAGGINLDFGKSWAIFLFAILAFLVVALINYLFQNRFLTLISFSFIFLSLGATYFSFYNLKSERNVSFGQFGIIEGKIISRPAIDSQKQVFVFESQDSSQQKVNFQVTTTVFPEFHYGQKVKISGSIEEAENFSPDFDYRGYLKWRHIAGLIKNPSSIEVEKSLLGPVDNFIASLYFISEKFENIINRILPEPHASLAAGILLGVKRNISDTMMADLQATGLTHIIALSGFNVTIIIAMLAALLVGLIGKKPTFWLGTTLVLFFVVMTGSFSSAIRAAIFSVLILFGKTYGRRADQTNLMLLAALVMILVNPFTLRSDVGFQLSFLAFAGLIYLSPLIGGWFEKGWRAKIPGIIRKPLPETLGAQIFVTPLIFAQFGVVSLISPFANVLVVGTVPFAMAFSFAAAVLGLIYYPLGKIAALVAWPSLEYIIKMVEWLAKVPWAAIHFN